MRDAAVVAQKGGAGAEAGGELGQGQRVPDGVAGEMDAAIGFGFAGDEDDFGLRESVCDLLPIFEGPVFLGGAAADVDGDAGVVGGMMREVGTVEVLVFEIHGELLQAFRELFGCVCSAFLNLWGAFDEGFHSDALETGAEEAIGIVEEADDEIEAAEVLGEGFVDGGCFGEQRGHGAVFEAADGIGEACGAGEFGDGGVADDFEMAAGNGFAQELERGEGEDEVANRTATNDEDSGLRVHQ